MTKIYAIVKRTDEDDNMIVVNTFDKRKQAIKYLKNIKTLLPNAFKKEKNEIIWYELEVFTI